MYIPEPRKNKDGTWSIQLRINKQSIMVNADSAKECKRRAAIVKAEAQNAAKPIKKSELTLHSGNRRIHQYAPKFAVSVHNTRLPQ